MKLTDYSKKKIYATKILIDFKIKEEGYAVLDDQKPDHCIVYISTNTGEIKSYNLMPIFFDKDFNLKIVKPESKRPNYNP